jgi:hypothetical protein
VVVVAMMVMPAMMTVMPTMMVMPMPSPMDLGGLDLGALLHRRGGAGIGQRERLGLLGWSGQNQQSANRSQAQKFRHVHVFSPLGSSGITPAARLRINPRSSAGRKLGRRHEQEMKTRVTQIDTGRAIRFPLHLRSDSIETETL